MLQKPSNQNQKIFIILAIVITFIIVAISGYFIMKPDNPNDSIPPTTEQKPKYPKKLNETPTNAPADSNDDVWNDFVNKHFPTKVHPDNPDIEIKEQELRNGGKSVTEWKKPNKMVKSTIYNPDGSFSSVTDYDPTTNKITKNINYNSKGSISSITEYDPQKSFKIIEETKCYENGDYKSIQEINPQTGQKAKFTSYHSNKSPEFIISYNSQNGNITEHIDYNPDVFIKASHTFQPNEKVTIWDNGSLWEILQYNDQNQKIKKPPMFPTNPKK